ncbi:MAG: IclR family transcriptional regulator [Leifsonia sp.]
MPGVNARDPRSSSVPAVHRAFAVLDLVAGRREPQPLHAISRDLSLPRSSALAICRALVAEDALRQDGDGRYLIGPRLVRLAHRYGGEIDLASAFSRAVDGLKDLRWTLQLAERTGREVIYLARRDGAQPLSLVSVTGRPLPASTTAVGKATLIRASDEELLRLYPRDDLLPSLTPASITSLDALRSELAAARTAGYTVDRGETMLGVVAAAAPVFIEGRDAPVAAISATTVDIGGGVSLEALAQVALSTAASMSALL